MEQLLKEAFLVLSEGTSDKLKDAGFKGKLYQIIKHPQHGLLRVNGTAPGKARIEVDSDGNKKKVNDLVLTADNEHKTLEYRIDVETANKNIINKIDWY